MHDIQEYAEQGSDPCVEQVWVRDVLEAQQVLDHRTGQRYAKAEVISMSSMQSSMLNLSQLTVCRCSTPCMQCTV